MSRFRRSAHFLGQVGASWRRDRIPDLAAGIAFYAILSIFPAFIALGAVLGTLQSVIGGDLADRAEAELIDYLGRVLTSEADGTLDAVRELFSQARPGLLTFSLLGALWALSRGFAAVVRSLDVVYGVTEHRSFVAIRATALALSIGSVVTGAIMLALVVVGPLFGSGRDIAERVGMGDQFVFLWDVLRWPVVLAVLVTWSATMFHVAPDRRTPWRRDLPGAAVTALGWSAVSLGFRGYVDIATEGNPFFSAIGGFLLLLLWCWLLAVCVLIGAEVNAIAAGVGQDRSDASGGEVVEGAAQSADEVPGVHG